MTDFQEAYNLLDDGKLYLDDLGHDRSRWIGRSREAHYEGDIFNYYFSILKDCDDSYFSRDWVVVEILCNTIVSIDGYCWLYISLKDYENNVCFIETTIKVEDGWESYCLAKDFVSSIDVVGRDWLKKLNEWLRGDYLET